MMGPLMGATVSQLKPTKKGVSVPPGSWSVGLAPHPPLLAFTGDMGCGSSLTWPL